MAVLLPHHFLFLGTPRSGSTTVHNALRTIPGTKVFNQHIPRQEMIDNHIGPYRGEFTFVAVRNPYDVIVSWYLRTPYGRRQGRLSFLDFIKTYQNKHLEKNGRLFFLIEDDMEVIRYENLQAELDRILTKLGLEPLELEVVNVTTKKEPWRTYYGPEEIEALNERFGHEVERYGYEKLDPADFPMTDPE